MSHEGLTPKPDSDFALLKNVIESTGKQIDENAFREDEDLDALCGAILAQVVECPGKPGDTEATPKPVSW